MIMFKKIRTKIGTRILRKRLRKYTRKKALYNFDNSKNIGVLFKAEDTKQIDEIKNFLQYLSDKKNNICAIGFVDQKIVPDNFQHKKGYNFFCRKDLDLYFLPNTHLVNDFLSKSYDILIDLSFDNHPALNYIVSMTNASFKIGSVKKTTVQYDFMIDLQTQFSTQSLIDNIKHYMEVFCNSKSLKTINL